MADYKYQKIVFLSNDFKAGEFSFRKNIQMSFTPTKMNVKYIHYLLDGTEPSLKILHMERIGIIGTFADSDFANKLNLGFNLGNINWTDGNYTFTIIKDDKGGGWNVNLAGRIVICLEFVG